MNKRSTIRDVAKAAGVSIATVSYVLKGVGRVSEATVKRVWDVVNELNYSPNPYAQKIFAKETTEREPTGLIMRIAYMPSAFPLNRNFQQEHLYLFDELCREYDYLGVNYNYRHERGFHCKQLVNGLLDGVLVGTGHRKIIRALSGRIPAVMMDFEVDPDEIGLPVVAMDEENGLMQILKHLPGIGITGNMALITGVDRKLEQLTDTLPRKDEAFYQGAVKSGITIHAEHRFYVNTSVATSDADCYILAEKLEKMIRDEGVRIIGLQALNYIQLKTELEARGIRFPEDAVLISRNVDHTVSRGCVLLKTDYEQIYRKSMEVLDGLIKGKITENKKYLIPYSNITYERL